MTVSEAFAFRLKCKLLVSEKSQVAAQQKNRKKIRKEIFTWMGTKSCEAWRSHLNGKEINFLIGHC